MIFFAGHYCTTARLREKERMWLLACQCLTYNSRGGEGGVIATVYKVHLVYCSPPNFETKGWADGKICKHRYDFLVGPGRSASSLFCYPLAVATACVEEEP